MWLSKYSGVKKENPRIQKTLSNDYENVKPPKSMVEVEKTEMRCHNCGGNKTEFSFAITKNKIHVVSTIQATVISPLHARNLKYQILGIVSHKSIQSFTKIRLTKR